MGTLSRTLVIPLANYPTGNRSFAVGGTLSDAATLIYAELARCTSADPSIWPNQSTKVKVICEISLDGGAVWLFQASFLSEGDIVLNWHGAEVALSTMEIPLFPGTSRRARFSVEITGGPCRTQGFLELRN
jgi:hypothetical protein